MRPLSLPAAEAQIARQREIIRLLHDVAVDTDAAPDFETALATTLERIGTLTRWPIGHVYRVEDSGENLCPSEVWWLPERERFAAWREATSSLCFVRGGGLPGRALASGEPVWITDLAADPAFFRAGLAEEMGIRTGFALPVRIGLEVVAVIEFFACEVITQDDLLMQALSHVGLQLGRVMERDRSCRNLQVVSEMAQAASRARSNFLANMSHELRTPLNAIIGFSETMVGELFGPVENKRYRNYLSYIHSAGLHLLDLINDILDLSRIENRRMILNERVVNAGAVLTVAVELLRPKAHSAGIGLESDIAADLPGLLADELRLRQITLNLLTNALSATPRGGMVTLRAHQDLQGGLAVSISDTGIGMTDEEVAAAMRPFEVGPAFTRPSDGIGLGLPLTRALIELHGGVLEMKSRKNIGTVATFRLPPHRLRPGELVAEPLIREA